jgi:ABC-type enterochelin transport system permease subunit
MLTEWIPIMLGLAPSSAQLLLGWSVHLLISLTYGGLFGVIIQLLTTQDSFSRIFKQEQPNYFQIGIVGLVYGIFLMTIAVLAFMLLWPSLFNTVSADSFLMIYMVINHVVYGLTTSLVYVFLQDKF